MPVKFTFREPLLMAWLLCRQCYDLVSKCEEKVFAKLRLTPQRHAVLIAIKYIDEPVHPADVADWLDRNPNNISTMVDRMEKDGLVERIRDMKDRRAVRLVLTEKGNKLLDQANALGWKLMQEILSSLSAEELQAHIKILERVRESAFKYLYPGKVMKEIRKNEEQHMAGFLAKVKKHDV